VPSPISSSDAEFLLSAYERVYRIRQFEQTAFDLSTSKEPNIVGSVHLCAGQEAVPIGALAALQEQDRIIATYRGHGWALECGVSAEGLLAELCHKAAGVNGGRSGSALVTAPNDRFLGENSIVGAGGPIACGAAMAAMLDGADRVVAVTFGDGATSQGALHEAFVFAVSRKLPVIFVCENNGWSEMTPISRITKLDRLAKRAAGYGIQGVTINGVDPLAVRETFALARERAGSGEGPVFIECRVPRLWGHYNRDIEHYRPKQERQEAQTRDPLLWIEQRLCERAISSAVELELLRQRIDQEWAAVVEKVLALPAPDPETAKLHVVGPHRPVLANASEDATAEVKDLTYIQAVNEALKAELASNPNVVVYGEDVGHAGGIFGASRYLQREFGEERVFDTPIAEAAILGSAVGAALEGKRPIVEIMWADFLLVALDQIINQAANIRYLTQGRRTVPLVVRVQQGATPGSTAQHSQCLEAMLSHIPGLRVGLPATPQDAYSMLRAAVADDDPVIIIESRALYQIPTSVSLTQSAEPAFGATLRRGGQDVALVGWGTVVPLLEQAASDLEKIDISATVLDLRWLAPLDWEAVCETVSACGGRVIVAHEANHTGGFGAEVITGLMERLPPGSVRFSRIAAPDVRIPASPVLQEALLPSCRKIVDAAASLFRANAPQLEKESA
jgi:Pyruvate/2-oxoglutarate dehydrogenase complex, dehydrogenase (E1) component, eukaryotic type, beta subunit